jgi:hypothetical protein
MNNTQIVRKIVEDLAKEVEDWSIKSSNMHPSDADGVIGFRKDIEENDEIGDRVTYLNHWDADNTGYLEGEDVQRDNGVGLARIVMQQITPIKS